MPDYAAEITNELRLIDDLTDQIAAATHRIRIWRSLHDQPNLPNLVGPAEPVAVRRPQPMPPQEAVTAAALTLAAHQE